MFPPSFVPFQSSRLLVWLMLRLTRSMPSSPLESYKQMATLINRICSPCTNLQYYQSHLSLNTSRAPRPFLLAFPRGWTEIFYILGLDNFSLCPKASILLWLLLSASRSHATLPICFHPAHHKKWTPLIIDPPPFWSIISICFPNTPSNPAT